MPKKLIDSMVSPLKKLTDRPGFNTGLALAFLLVLLILSRVVTNTYYIRVINQAGVYVMMALGLNVILGYTGLLNMGYAGYFAIGAYMWAILASAQYNLHFPFWVVFPLAGLVTGLVGFILSLPVRDLKGDYFALVTIGLSEIIRILANNLSLTNAAMGIPQIDQINLGFYKLTTDYDYFYFLIVIIIIEIIVMKRLENSYIGTAWMAIREDEGAAKAMGINTGRMKLLACFIGAIPAGLAGVIFASMQTYVSPVSFKMSEDVLIICMVMVGGRGNVAGAVLGGLLLTLLPEPLRGTSLDSARLLVYGALLVIMAVFRPQGILPRRYKGKRMDSVEETSPALPAAEPSAGGK